MSNATLMLLSCTTSLGSDQSNHCANTFFLPLKAVLFITADTARLPGPSLTPTVLIMRKEKHPPWRALCTLTL